MPRAVDGLKICSNVECGQEGRAQPAENFSPDSSNADGLESRCKACRAKEKRNGTQLARGTKTTELIEGALATGQLTKLEQLAECLHKQTGGQQAFIADYWDFVRGAKSESVKQRGFANLLGLLVEAGKLADKRKDEEETMTPEEVERHMAEVYRKLQKANALEGEFTKVPDGRQPENNDPAPA